MKKTGQEQPITKFNLIKCEYQAYYNDLMQRGLFPFGNTSSGYYGPSDLNDLFFLFKKINLGKYKSFVDLGSGDGCVVLLASLFTNTTGFEIDDELYGKSNEIKSKLIKKLNKKNKLEIYDINFLKENFSRYDVIYIYPDQPIYELEKKLLNEMKKSAILIVYGNLYQPLQLKKIKEFDFDGIKAGVYRK